VFAFGLAGFLHSFQWCLNIDTDGRGSRKNYDNIILLTAKIFTRNA